MTPLEELEAATDVFLRAMASLDDDELAAPSLLPGWTRHHVVAHVHFNALALGRLVSWAATGVESRMYAGPAQRAAEIEQGRTIPASDLRVLVRASAGELAAGLAALPRERWDFPVVTARGREVPAADVPWLRTREVAVHAVDLDTGVEFEDLPDDLLRRLNVEAVGMHAATSGPASMAAWLTGRSPRAPHLAAWL